MLSMLFMAAILRRSEFAADADRGAVRAATASKRRRPIRRRPIRRRSQPKQERDQGKDKERAGSGDIGTSKDRLFLRCRIF